MIEISKTDEDKFVQTIRILQGMLDDADLSEYEALKTAIKSLESLQTISNLFSKWQNGEVDDNEYFFQMQNILLFGKTLDGR